jgi:hypothetical protein
MKRAADSDADSLFKQAAAILEQNGAMLAAYVTDPLPSIPLKDVERMYDEMAERFLDNASNGKPKARFVMYDSLVRFRDSASTPRNRWWNNVAEWEKATQTRTDFIEQHGTKAQLDQHKQRIADAHDAFRAEFSRHWNDLNHGVPGDWEGHKRCNMEDDATLDFVVRYQPEKAE